jgi:hypothetical protein
VHQPDGVVRVAQQYAPRPCGQGPVDAAEVERVGRPVIQQRDLRDGAARLGQQVEERRVDRRHDGHARAGRDRAAQRLHGDHADVGGHSRAVHLRRRAPGVPGEAGESGRGLVSCGLTYPVSPASTASSSAALISGARPKSISATNIGSTSAGNVPYLSLLRRRRDSCGSASFILTSQA